MPWSEIGDDAFAYRRRPRADRGTECVWPDSLPVVPVPVEPVPVAKLPAPCVWLDSLPVVPVPVVPVPVVPVPVEEPVTVARLPAPCVWLVAPPAAPTAYSAPLVVSPAPTTNWLVRFGVLFWPSHKAQPLGMLATLPDHSTIAPRGTMK